MDEPVWLPAATVRAIHAESLALFGGAPGIADVGMLESACDRPRNQHAYGGSPGLAGLAAAYAFGLCRNHPFVDGNKRIAFIAAFVFLDLNGWYLDAPEADAYRAMMAVAAGEWGEADLAAWMERWARPAEL